MKKKSFILLLTLAAIISLNTQAQIYEPEGLNMPGDWDSWANPPTNLVLANPNQTVGGLLVKQNNAVPRWTTTINVAATGGDLSEGFYSWIFTSGPDGNYFQNKWSSVDVTIDDLQNYTYGGADDNTVALENDFYYTMVWEDIGYVDSRAIFMKTSLEPVEILTVSEPTGINANEAVDVDFTIAAAPCPEEYFYLQYTTDGWATAHIINPTLNGTSGTAIIPGQAESTVVEYNIFSSSVSNVSSDGFLYAMRINDKNELNYSYTIGVALPDTIGWCNLQWPNNGQIQPEQEYLVYGRAFIYNVTEQTDPVAGLDAWVGWNDTDTDPSTWTNWVAAPYFGNVGNEDEFSVDLGAEITTEGTYYYASRFKYLDQDFVYGGYSADGGDFWDGLENVSGELIVSNDPIPDEISWCNLEGPSSGEILPLEAFLVYGQVYIEEITNGEEVVADLDAWIGWSDIDSDPSTWTNWIAADFDSNQGNNDQYISDLGTEMSAEGTFYYATRFKYQDQDYEYGGYSESGGNFWDGANHVSGVLAVTNDPTPDEINWCNLQWPPSGEIEPSGVFLVYAQVFIDGITNSSDPVDDLQAWIGYGDVGSDPTTWIHWFPASFSSHMGNNDEYILDLGEEMTLEGAFEYATRFQYQDQAYVYGGYNESGGGFWNGTDNVSGILNVLEDPVGDTIAWANLQWPPMGEIVPNQEFIVYGQAFIDGGTAQSDSLTDLQVWVGYNDLDTDPASWTNWIPAWYLQDDGDNDEYAIDLGSMMGTLGTYYYATRFQYEDQDFVYGGFSEWGGDFWDGVENISGVLTVTNDPLPDTIGWCNLQWPPNGSIEPNAEFNIYCQAWIDGISSQADSLVDLQAWIGYSVNNTNPAEWTDWIPAWYSSGDGENDEYLADLGAVMGTEGTFYYASRFMYLDQDYVYGGFSVNGGGFWDGLENVNGMLTVEEGTSVFPVEFVVTDATGLYSNIKLKGDMTSWSNVDMQQDGNEWSVTLDISPGTYEWGILEDDGTANGIWLIVGDNLVVSVDAEGNVAGETTYTVTYVGIDELASSSHIYPNPVHDQLWINHTSDQIIHIRLLDAAGKLINEFKSVEDQIVLELQELTNGLYFLEINDGDHHFRSKIIKQ